MHREIYITVYAENRIAARDEYGNDTDFLGYAGETEATQVTIYLPDWTGSFYLDWLYSGEWHEGETAYGTEIICFAPQLPAGDVYLRIRAIDGNTTLYTGPIKFRVRP